MYFAGRNHRCYTAVHVTVDPVDLALPWCPVTYYRVYVAVDQPWSHGCSHCINGDIDSFCIHVSKLTNGCNLSVHRKNGISIRDWRFKRTGQQQTNIFNQQLALGHFCGGCCHVVLRLIYC